MPVPFSASADTNGLAGELADVIITAAVALVRVTGGPDAARAAFEAHLAGVLARSGRLQLRQVISVAALAVQFWIMCPAAAQVQSQYRADDADFR
jgi:hypothetical protein